MFSDSQDLFCSDRHNYQYYALYDIYFPCRLTILFNKSGNSSTIDRIGKILALN